MSSTIRIHIDRLVLEGMDIDLHQQAHLKAAIEAELTAQLTQHIANGQALPAQLQTNTNLPNTSLDLIAHPTGQPLAIGQQISQTIHNYLIQSI